MSPDHDLKPSEAGDLPQGEAKVKAVRAMFDAIAPRYDLVNRVMTFGMDVGWRRATVAGLGLAPGGVVIDIAAGTGDLCRELSASGHTPLGIDLSWEMLAHARTGAPLVQADALRLPLPAGSVDGATCGFALRNLADLPLFFAELARVVRPGGRIGLLEVAEPTMPLMRRGHNLYFTKVVPLIGGWLSDAAAYRYLPRSVAYLPDPAGLVAQLREAGFSAVHRRALSGGIAQLLTATCGRR
ncbi:MAG TPA: ubiquinone/menaquinone biosynthesis methyltransferase [Acidimicrobiales bacterium]|nr:ubiquinone/menaquinone biosynthesis methyltransferase [Acidimicrobiales bacterium]